MVSSVLVVDDDPDFLALATRILESMGIARISTAEDAATAMAEADATRPQAALVDVGLPDGDGIELAHRLATLPWAPRVVLTSTDKDAAGALGPGRGGSEVTFVPKEELGEARLRPLFTRVQPPGGSRASG
jgi:CheY-like chemotaxis protein